MSKILFCTGEGIGNVIQTIPVIRTLTEVMGHKVDFWHAHGSYGIKDRLIPYVGKWIVGNQIANLDMFSYDGYVSTLWTRNVVGQGPFARLALLNKIQMLSMDRSEVDTYMDIARDLGVEEKDILWHGNCAAGRTDEKFDIVMHNGYNRHGSANWSVKSYQRYGEVVEYLEGVNVCSIGAKEEYIEGTEDRTGLSLPESLGLIKNARLFVGNDSGLYHCANALETDNIVIFTATSIKKNFDERFHKYSTIVTRDDLECRPCQKTRSWQKECDDWKCRDIDPEIVLYGIKQVIMARFMSEASEVYENETIDAPRGSTEG
jgi:hypothetical protein